MRKRASTPFSLFSFQDIITSVTGIIILISLLLAIEVVHQRASSPSGRREILADQTRKVLEDVERQTAELEAQLASGKTLAEEVAQATPERLARETARLESVNDSLRREVSALARAEKRQQSEIQDAQTKTFDRRTDRARVEALKAEAERIRRETRKVREGGRLYFREAEGGKRAWLVEISRDRIGVEPVDRSEPPLVFQDALPADRAEALLAFARRRPNDREYFVIFLKPGTSDQFEGIAERLEKLRFDIGFDLIGEKQSVVGAEVAP